MKRRDHTPIRRFFTSRAFLVVGLCAAVLSTLGFARAYYEDYSVRQEIRRLEDEVRGLERKKLESMEILKYVGSQNFVEDRARVELNLKKPGEQVAIIPPADSALTTAEPVPTANQPEPLNNPAKWWYYFTAHRLPPAE